MTIEKKMTTNTEGRKPTVTPASFLAESEWKSRLLRKPELVRTDVFVGLEPDEVEMIREASERGLKPGGFSVEGNTAILRFIRPLEKYPSGRFRTHHDVCQYPIGTIDGKDTFCSRDAIQEIEGYLFCDLHGPMAERGCLDSAYTDGTTPREIIEAAAEDRKLLMP